MTKPKRSHRHRTTKILPYGVKESKKATTWCAFDNHLLPEVMDRGALNQKVKKDIHQRISEMKDGES